MILVDYTRLETISQFKSRVGSNLTWAKVLGQLALNGGRILLSTVEGSEALSTHMNQHILKAIS